jgi:hypothetical protein
VCIRGCRFALSPRRCVAPSLRSPPSAFCLLSRLAAPCCTIHYSPFTLLPPPVLFISLHHSTFGVRYWIFCVPYRSTLPAPRSTRIGVHSCIFVVAVSRRRPLAALHHSLFTIHHSLFCALLPSSLHFIIRYSVFDIGYSAFRTAPRSPLHAPRQWVSIRAYSWLPLRAPLMSHPSSSSCLLPSTVRRIVIPPPHMIQAPPTFLDSVLPPSAATQTIERLFRSQLEEQVVPIRCSLPARLSVI